MSANEIELTLTRLKSSESISVGLISVLGTTLKGKEKEFIARLMADTAEDAKFEAQKQSNELKLSKFNENTKINDFVKNLDPLVITKQIEDRSDRTLLANCEKTFKQLLQDPTEGKRILQILEKVRQ